jgi:hypothetical protein
MLFKALLLVLCAPVLLLAQEAHFYNFGGLNNTGDSMMISDSDAQDAANVLTDKGDMRSMMGSVELYDVGQASITSLGSYVAPGNIQSLVAQSGDAVYISSSGGSFVSVQAITAGQIVDGVAAFNRFYFSDGTNLYNFNGSSVTTESRACSFIEFYANRLVCASASTDTSRVDLSAYNAPENWNIITTADSAVQKYLNRSDGQNVTCVKSTPYGIFVGKENSCGVLKGSDAKTFYWFPLSNEIGCLDDRTVQLVDKSVVWLSGRGAYAWSGRGDIEPISREIENTTKHIKSNTSKTSYWTVDSQSEWEAGELLNGWDSTAYPGTIRAKTYNTGNVASTLNFGSAGEAYDSGLSSPDYEFTFTGTSMGGFDWTASLTMQFYYSTDNVSWNSVILDTGSVLPEAAKQRYFKLKPICSVPNYCSLNVVQLSVFSTSTYRSPVLNIGEVPAKMGGFAIAATTDLFTTKVRGSTTAFVYDAALPDWLDYTAPTLPYADPFQYFQYEFTPTISTTTQALTINSTVLGWTIGTASPRMASLSYDGRYLLCASTTSTTVNDVCLLWQKNKKWIPITGLAYASLVVHDNLPLGGDTTTGSKIWSVLRDGVNKYGSQPINSYWTTKDYTLGKFDNHKVLQRVWITADGGGTSNLGVAWQADRSGVWESTTTSLSGTFNIKEVDGLFEDNYPVRQVRFKFSNSELDTDWKLKLFSLYYKINDLIK